ncbi:MAG: efflux RND transporter periplasmic adaptor subunit [Planctomycetales bacterium]|nr:efflux RND transporter periplasmic adaptor subunit [Planctomycetales bacterium]
MTTASHAHGTPRQSAWNWASRLKLTRPVFAFVLFVVLLGIFAAVWNWLPPSNQEQPQAAAGTNAALDQETDDAETADAAAADEVRLSTQKQESAGLHTVQVQRQTIQPRLTVPGKLDYDRAHYLEVKSPTEAVIGKVLVNAGQSVKSGDHLATMISPEVGQARDAVKHAEAELKLVERKLDWTKSVATNVNALLTRLDDRPTMQEIEGEFRERPLGAHRESIVATYSKLLLAEFTLSGSESLSDQGVLSQRTIQERRSQREIAQAAFQAACETSRYEAELQRDTEQVARDHAQQQVELSRERMATLFGPSSDNQLNEAGRGWGEFELHASIDGVIAERRVVDGERVTAGQPLFTLANLERMWVTAHLRQQQWETLQLTENAEVTFRADSPDAQPQTARVRFVASLVSPDSHTLPLVAEFINTSERLKPGMFVRVTLPSGPAREAIVVPRSALMRHENEMFVFVRESAESFRRVPITTGMETADSIEILSGVEPGMEVVDAGAFVLKSEWLLDTLAE